MSLESSAAVFAVALSAGAEGHHYSHPQRRRRLRCCFRHRRHRHHLRHCRLRCRHHRHCRSRLHLRHRRPHQLAEQKFWKGQKIQRHFGGHGQPLSIEQNSPPYIEKALAPPGIVRRAPGPGIRTQTKNVLASYRRQQQLAGTQRLAGTAFRCQEDIATIGDRSGDRPFRSQNSESRIQESELQQFTDGREPGNCTRSPESQRIDLSLV